MAMRQLLFKAAAAITIGLIRFSDGFYSFLSKLSAWMFSVSRVAIASTGYWVLGLIDSEQREKAKEETEQAEELQAQRIELDLLKSATKVRDHAKTNNEWNASHSEAITAIGNALLNECDWEEEHVHQYLKEVVESVPGLTYGTGGD
jgi:hypothetical protein